MQAEQLKQLIESQLASCIAQVQSNDDIHFQAMVISSEFTDLSLVKRQQRVYATLGDAISSGEVHALSLKTYTPEEWRAQQVGTYE